MLNLKKVNYFRMGFRQIFPVVLGAVPMGAVIGSIYSEAQLNILQSVGMNIFVFAGASQLATVDLMTRNAAAAVIILTGLIINLRFVLYSAALSPIMAQSRLLTKMTAAYLTTDQSYAAMSANEGQLPDRAAVIEFYFGSAFCMWIFWHLAVVAGFIFGNFAPPSWSLDFGVPLSFLVLVVPTLKNKKYVYVAIFSAALSIALYTLPLKLGMTFTTILAITLGAILSRKAKT